jgi:membrane-associated protease RseP (regulator of RpoE activity)
MNQLSPILSEDLTQIKSIFGIDTFFATETVSYQEGVIFKGNLRGEPQQTHAKLSAKLKNICSDKYRLFLVESPEDKPVVIVLPSSQDPAITTLSQKNLALVLFVATVFTSFEAISLMLGFDLFKQSNRFLESLPLALGLLLILAVHEIAHHIVAKRYQVKLSIPFFLPSWQVGSFGAINRFESLLPNRQALFDIAFAGPALGALVSLLVLVAGLFNSSNGILQVPSTIFHSSILVGILAHLTLGDALAESMVKISPLVALGWLGLMITAVNLLPAGQLDGGRIALAIYGRKIARRLTLATIIILGLVALGNPDNSLALYWELVILFLQRELEKPSLNEITEINDTRAALGLLVFIGALLVLFPIVPSLSARLGF